jgi:hypothetical protein
MMSPSAAPDLADQIHQFRHLNALQREHRSLNIRAQALVSAAAHKPFEFGGYLVPGERPRRKPGVTVHLMAVRLATLEPNDDPAWHLAGVAGREAVVGPDLNLLEQALDVRLRDPPRIKLCRLDVAIEGCDGKQVREAVVGIFLRVDISTTLADLFTPEPFADLSSAIRASLRSWLNDEIDDGLAYGR